ncbi:hypothetical protein ABG768_002345 [Culter alburnus]|uniref:Uncharacterized protein n=1 Tax=Culter alburnus TaxID=194366 RepID=A0AAW2A5I0_CULAL
MSGQGMYKRDLLLAQLSHQTDLPQSVIPLLCQSTRLSLSGKRQPIRQPLTLRVTAVAMVTAGPMVAEAKTVDNVRDTAAQLHSTTAARLKVTRLI